MSRALPMQFVRSKPSLGLAWSNAEYNTFYSILRSSNFISSEDGGLSVTLSPRLVEKMFPAWYEAVQLSV